MDHFYALVGKVVPFWGMDVDLVAPGMEMTVTNLLIAFALAMKSSEILMKECKIHTKGSCTLL